MIETLVLWDVDRTLIDTRGFSRRVYERAFAEVAGVPCRGLPDMHGRTERAIMLDLLADHEIEPTDEFLVRLSGALTTGHEDGVEELARTGAVLPGVVDVLATIAADRLIHQSVLTGNTAGVGRMKVRAFGLDRYLDLESGAYGDDHVDRAHLVGVARARAAAALGTAPQRTVLIGDTPNDIAAAQDAGAEIIAVATGYFSVEQLRAAGADFVVPDLARGRAAALERIRGVRE